MKIDINNHEELQDLYRKTYPCGSGPRGLMRIIASLIESIAEEKGFVLTLKDEVENNKI